MKDSENFSSFNHLLAWRELKGWTQAQVAERVDTNANMIGYLESGRRDLRATWIRRLSSAFEIEPYELLMHPDAAMAMRRLRETAAQIAADTPTAPPIPPEPPKTWDKRFSKEHSKNNPSAVSGGSGKPVNLGGGK